MKNEALEVLGLKEAAKRLNLTSEHLRRLCDAGAVPHMRDSSGKRLLISVDVERLRRERERAKNGGRTKVKVRIGAKT
jgi:excisionase family DNA binding protein